MPSSNSSAHDTAHSDDEESLTARPYKRQRVSLACQRCKSRKQKCDGSQPACRSCVKTETECRYVGSTRPRAAEQKLYVKALEERVAELESGLSEGGKVGVADDHWERLPPKEDVVNSLSGAIRDLSLNASGYYVGATTHISLGQLLGSALQGERQLVVDGETEKQNEPTRTQTAAGISTQPESFDVSNISLFSGSNIDVVFDSYLSHVSTQYPVMHSKKLRELHAKRVSLNDTWEIAILHFVYAIGGRSLELTGKPGSYSSDEHYEAAMASKDAIIQYIDRRSIIFLALATMYCLRAPRDPGPWMMIGLAMKICVGVGIHRKPNRHKFGLVPFSLELDKRLFWTCYLLDRDVAISTGRPNNLSDHDIDSGLPLDVDEHSVALDDFRKATRQDPNVPANPPSTLSHFIHIVRLKRIQSAIQGEIYRVDQAQNPPHEIIDKFLEQLFQWQQISPSERGSSNGTASPAAAHLKDLYMIQYYLSIRLLLFPQLSENPVNMRYLKLCAKACAGICENYKRLHHNSALLSYSSLATQWLFLSGLTLIYCMWHAPEEVLTLSSTSAVYACSTMLYVMTERWPAAYRYRNAFEEVKESVFDLISSGSQQPRVAVSSINSLSHSILDSANPAFPDSVVADLNQIMGNMSGEREMYGGWSEQQWGLDIGALHGELDSAAVLANNSSADYGPVENANIGGIGFEDVNLDWDILGTAPKDLGGIYE